MEKDPDSRNDKGQFVKGKSGNPGGRPKRAKVLSCLIQEALDTEDGPTTNLAVNTAIEILRTGKDSDRLAAIKILLEYGYGKPINIDLSSDEDGLSAQRKFVILFDG